MKILSEEFQTHITSEVTTLCRCWILETVEGQKLGFTDHDQDILLENTLCEKDAGFETSVVEERIGLDINTSEIAGALQSNHITGQDIDAGKYDNARIKTYMVNWSDPSQSFLNKVLIVGEILREDGHYRMELRSLSSQLDQSMGNHFVRRCQADLGDVRCRVSLSSFQFTTSGEVLKVSSQLVISVNGLSAYKNSWFRGGHLTWASGDNINRRIEVTEHIHTSGKTVLHLWQPLPDKIRIGDRFSVQAGCDKDFTTCSGKFANTINFRGFPHTPGNKFAHGYAANSDNFDGGAITP